MAKAPQHSAGFVGTATGFFTKALETLAAHPPLAFAWAVCVLLFFVFLALISSQAPSPALPWFGGFIVVAILALAVFTLRLRSADPAPDSAPSASSSPTAETPVPPQLAQLAKRSLALLDKIDRSNRQLIEQARAGPEPWPRLMGDAYNHICRDCQQRRLGGAAPDAYLDTLCADANVKAICDNKWLLGEAMEDYRRQLDQLRPPPDDHDQLERLIRRSVTQPDCTPTELETAVRVAITEARRVASKRNPAVRRSVSGGA
jgi:hypothetical protein